MHQGETLFVQEVFGPERAKGSEANGDDGSCIVDCTVTIYSHQELSSLPNFDSCDENIAVVTLLTTVLLPKPVLMHRDTLKVHSLSLHDRSLHSQALSALLLPQFTWIEHYLSPSSPHPQAAPHACLILTRHRSVCPLPAAPPPDRAAAQRLCTFVARKGSSTRWVRCLTTCRSQ